MPGMQVKRVGIAALRRKIATNEKAIEESQELSGNLKPGDSTTEVGMDVSSAAESKEASSNDQQLLHKQACVSTEHAISSAPAAVVTLRNESISGDISKFTDIRVACNAIKTFAPAVSAALGSKEDLKLILETSEDISYKTIAALGISDEERINMNIARILPDVVRLISEIHLEDPELLSDKEIMSGIADCLVISGTASQSSRLMPKAYKAIDPSIDLRISVMAASAQLTTEIVLYRFDSDISNDIRFGITETMMFSKKVIGRLVPSGINEETALPLAQSTIRNMFGIMAACWRRQAAIASATPIEEIRRNAAAWRNRVKDDFLATATTVIALTEKFVTHEPAETRSDQASAESKKKGRRRASMIF